MGRIRGWLKRLERDARAEMISIPQKDGTVKRFPQSALRDAVLNLIERMGTGEEAPTEHPLVAAARNSSEAEWSESVYASGGKGWTEPAEDLSE